MRGVMHAPRVLVAVALTLSCGGESPTTPSQPARQGPPDFIIATGMNAIPVGGGASFGVTAYTAAHVANAYVFGIPQSADVSDRVGWMSDNAAVASFRRGILVGQRVGRVNIMASYMGQTHTLPVDVVGASSVAQQFAGSWSGMAHTRCEDLKGNTRTCEYRTGPMLSLLDVTLSLTAVDGVLQGTIDFGGHGRSHSIGPVVAGVTADGALVIGGETRFDDEEYLPEQLREWRFTRVGSTLLGSGVVDYAFVNIYGPVWHREILVEITLQ
jgi:hypothetical protein